MTQRYRHKATAFKATFPQRFRSTDTLVHAYPPFTHTYQMLIRVEIKNIRLTPTAAWSRYWVLSG